MSEALMYAEHHRKGATKENIVNVMCSFFTDNEMKTAKSLLYDRFGYLNILLSSTERRTTENRSDTMATCCDVIDDLFKLEDEEIQVTCCATNWARLPRVAPEEINNISLADKVATLAAKLEIYDSALSEIRCENSKIETRMSSIENNKSTEWPQLISNKSKSVPRDNPRHTPGAASSTPPPRLLRQSSNADCNGINGDVTNPRENVNHMRRDRNGTNLPERRNYMRNEGSDINRRGASGVYDRRVIQPLSNGRQQREMVGRIGSQTDSRNSSRVPGFKRRGGGIMGEATSGGLRSSEPPVRDFFVSRLNKMDGIPEIREFLKKCDIDVRDIVQMNNSESKFNSYKISVTVFDAPKMLNSDMWQSGICVRRWKNFNNN